MKNPWIPFYWGDYLAHTTHLSTFEHGCYILLLARYYVTGKPLTTLEDGLFRVCHANNLEERNSVMKVVTEFFVEKLGAYHHGRADEEIKKRASISKIRSDARSHRVNKSSTNEELMTTQSQSYSQPLKAKSKAYVRPILEDVKKYCLERNNGINPEQWFDHYTARGWKVKGGGAMVDWKACVRTWERNTSPGGSRGYEQSSSKQKQRSQHNYESLIRSSEAFDAARTVPDSSEREGGTGRSPEPGVLEGVRKTTSGSD